MRLSTGLENRLADSLKHALAGYVIDIYSGVQPTLPDNVPNGTLLCTVTKGGSAYTPETAATGTLTLSGTLGGSVDTVKLAIGGGTAFDILGGSVAYDGVGLNSTATLVAAQINRSVLNHYVIATTTGASAVITLTAVNGLGATVAWVISATYTTLTATGSTMSGGVTAVNGLNYDNAVAGTINKIAADTWQGTAGSAGFTAGTATAGWFRIRGAGDAGTVALATALRIDGSIGTSGADMNLGSLTLTYGAPFVVPTGSLTVPQQ